MKYFRIAGVPAAMEPKEFPNASFYITLLSDCCVQSSGYVWFSFTHWVFMQKKKKKKILYGSGCADIFLSGALGRSGGDVEAVANVLFAVAVFSSQLNFLHTFGCQTNKLH
jgi:hypothetical protein